MNFDKQIWYLFKLNRNDFNRTERKIKKVLNDIFEQGKKAGKKEERKLIKTIIK